MLKWIDIPPVWLAASCGLAWLSRWLWSPAFPSWIGALGWALIVSSLLVMLWTVIEMGRHRTTPIPHMEPSALVSSGPFGFSRNPIYLGDAVFLGGFCLIANAPLGLILIPAFMVLIGQRFIVAEEGRLTRAFGEDFTAYAKRVGRWL